MRTEQKTSDSFEQKLYIPYTKVIREMTRSNNQCFYFMNKPWHGDKTQRCIYSGRDRPCWQRWRTGFRRGSAAARRSAPTVDRLRRTTVDCRPQTPAGTRAPSRWTGDASPGTRGYPPCPEYPPAIITGLNTLGIWKRIYTGHLTDAQGYVQSVICYVGRSGIRKTKEPMQWLRPNWVHCASRRELRLALPSSVNRGSIFHVSWKLISTKICIPADPYCWYHLSGLF